MWTACDITMGITKTCTSISHCFFNTGQKSLHIRAQSFSRRAHQDLRLIPPHDAPRRRFNSMQCQSRRYSNVPGPLDTTLAWGDIITLAATEISSDRVPLNQTGLLCVVLVLAWVGAATAKGDYSFRYGTSSSLVFGQQQVDMLKATFSACLTWVMFTPVAVACYASLVSHKIIPTTVFASKHGEIPPQLEVLVATLFTVSSWRGIYVGLKPWM